MCSVEVHRWSCVIEFCVRITCDLCEIIQIINFLNSEQLFSCCLSVDDMSHLSDMLNNEVANMLVTLFRFAYSTTADIVLSTIPSNLQIIIC